MESTPQPGDYILDQRMPDATPEEREAARERLYAFARVLLRIAERQEREADVENSRGGAGRHRMGV